MFGIVKQEVFTKEDLQNAYDEHFKNIRNFLYYKTGNKELAEDLVQDTFIKLWENRDNIKKKTLKNFLYTIANNMMINHFNHMKVVGSHQKEKNDSGYKEIQTPEFVIEEKEFEVIFNKVMENMPDSSREVFLMNRIEQLKYNEIADLLQISVKTVEKRMSKALSIIKEEIGRKI